MFYRTLKNRVPCLIACILFLTSPAYTQNIIPYKNPKLPVETRVKDLLARMTPEEKFWQLFMIPGDLDNSKPGQYKNGIFGFQVSAGAQGDAGGQLLSYRTTETVTQLAKKTNAVQRYFVEQTRLGIPIISFDEALHGLVRQGATAFPQAIGLAASWDVPLMHRSASAIAAEAKIRGIRQVLSPVVNIASDVRWGRTEETYGEDPYLASEMGVAFVSAFEKAGIVTTPKHFLANVGDGGRDSYPIHFNERLLAELYLPPFKAAFKRGGSRSVMTSYNSIDGSPATGNNRLLNIMLKKDWGFRGFVISDASAVGGANVLHYTASGYDDAGKQAIIGGLDVIFQTEYEHHKLFIGPFLNGQIPPAVIDSAVARVLRAKFELGLFEHPYIDENPVSPQHKAIAKEAALKSMVLLKNDGETLPFKKPGSIAVIGPDAEKVRLGGYSGPGNNLVSILDGIKAKAGNTVKVKYTPGPGIHTDNLVPVPAAFLSADGKSGLKGEYFSNITLQGQPAVTRTDAALDFQWTLYPPDPKLPADTYSVRWSGQLKSPGEGLFDIGLEGNDGFRLYINNELIIDNWQKRSFSMRTKSYAFKKDQQYSIRVEFYEPVGNARIRLVWSAGADVNWQTKINEAVQLAKQAETVVIVAGIHEGEFQDRAMLSLPGHQEELIEQVAATGKPVTVLLVGGSAITMNNWLDKVGAVLNVWYPGEEGGHAIADVLFGSYNPAGRLPITYPLHEAQLPLVYNHKPTGRGDDYYNLSGLPLFPFGYGLSYTRFEYSTIRLDKKTIAPNGKATVYCTVKNTGKVKGEEVVQLYIRDLLASVARPVMELKGFQRIELLPGQSKEVTFEIGQEALSMLDINLKEVVEPGEFRIMIGASSRDIRLKETLTVK